jgi:hypothetical protein
MAEIKSIRRLVAAAMVAITALAGCGDDDSASVDQAGAEADGTAANACPQDGCVVGIADVVAAGDELTITFEADFAPDLDRNHFHVYWDVFSAQQVSSDAVDNGVEQGEWVPTDSNPYTTEGATSTSVRGESTMLCVTAADGDHAVIDTSSVECQDVSDLL